MPMPAETKKAVSTEVSVMAVAGDADGAQPVITKILTITTPIKHNNILLFIDLPPTISYLLNLSI